MKKFIVLAICGVLLAGSIKNTQCEEFDPLAGFNPYLIAGGVVIGIVGILYVVRIIQGPGPGMQSFYEDGEATFSTDKEAAAEKFRYVIKIYESGSTEEKKQEKLIYLNQKAQQYLSVIQDFQNKQAELQKQKEMRENCGVDCAKFAELLNIGLDCKQQKLPMFAVTMFETYNEKKAEISSLNGRYRYDCSLGCDFDTVQTSNDSIEKLRDFVKVVHKEVFTQIDSLKIVKHAFDSTRTKLLKNAIVLSGEVQNINGSTISIWGKAGPYVSINPEGGLSGMMAAGAVSALSKYVDAMSGMLGKPSGISDPAETIQGCTNEDANLVVNGFTLSQKYFGSAVAGSTITAGPYVNKGQKRGTNAYNAPVAIYSYVPHPNLGEINSLKSGIASCQTKIDSLLVSLSVTEMKQLTDETKNKMNSLSDFITKK